MYLLQIILLFLPAGLANMVPPFAAKMFPKYNNPLDFGLTFKGKRIFGDHKTIRGIILGTLIGGLLYYLQRYLYLNSSLFNRLSLIDYTQVSPLFAFAISFGALFGDALKSFFKRQLNIKPGTSWFPWDQIDWVIGSLLFSSFFIPFDFVLSICFIFTGLILHLLVKLIGFVFKINETLI